MWQKAVGPKQWIKLPLPPFTTILYTAESGLFKCVTGEYMAEYDVRGMYGYMYIYELCYLHTWNVFSNYTDPMPPTRPPPLVRIEGLAEGTNKTQ